MRVRHLAFLSISVIAGLAASLGTACSSSSTPGTTPDDAGAADTGTTDVGQPAANEAKQTGRVIGALDRLEIPDVTVTIDGKSAKTKGDGTYEIIVPKNKPYTMSVSGEGFYKLNEQEWILKKDSLARGDTSLLSVDTANLLASFLPGRDKAKGLLVVKVQPIAPCDDEGGSTLTIEPAGDSKIVYFAGGRPNADAKSAEKGASFSAAVYNVETGVNIKVNVVSPKCQVVPYPIDQSEVTYTGNQKTEPGDVLSYVRAFIGPLK
ncbi:MAG: hypothetical protein JST00_05780 [Deltaproteobacteria bacterium]|nr:hypothetical protein [Deltaproteobacteria bacterium]